jgi:hypothetical protein
MPSPRVTVTTVRRHGQGHSVVVKARGSAPCLGQASTYPHVAANLGNIDISQMDGLAHETQALAARGRSRMVSAFQSGRDKDLDHIDLALVQERAADAASSLHQDVGHAATAQLFQ